MLAGYQALIVAQMIDKDRQASCFSFSAYNYEPENGRVTLSYAVDGQELHEEITFPWAPWPSF